MQISFKSQTKFAKFNNVHKDMLIVFLKWLDTMEGTNFDAPQYYEIFYWRHTVSN